MAGPLAGVKVLDFTFYLPGPFCVFILTDLGADTIKVERVLPRPAAARRINPKTIKKAYDPRDRNKRSIALDLKSKEGKEIYLKLAARSDVVVVEGRPGMPERLGLGYKDIKQNKSQDDLLPYLRFRLRRPDGTGARLRPELCRIGRGAGPDWLRHRWHPCPHHRIHCHR